MSEQRTPEKLTPGQFHILKLIRKEADAEGWAPISKAVAPLFTDRDIRGGVMPQPLCVFEPVGNEGRGRARLTQLGINVLDAAAWLL